MWKNNLLYFWTSYLQLFLLRINVIIQTTKPVSWNQIEYIVRSGEVANSKPECDHMTSICTLALSTQLVYYVFPINSTGILCIPNHLPASIQWAYSLPVWLYLCVSALTYFFEQSFSVLLWQCFVFQKGRSRTHSPLGRLSAGCKVLFRSQSRKILSMRDLFEEVVTNEWSTYSIWHCETELLKYWVWARVQFHRLLLNWQF